MQELIDELNYKRKKFGKIFILSILGVLAYFIILTFLLPFIGHEQMVSREPLLFSFFGIALTTYILSKTEFDSWPIYRIMTLVIAALVFYFSLCLHHITSVILLFYIPVVLMIWMLTDLKTAITATLILLIICYFTPNIADYFLITNSVKHTEDDEILHKLQDYIVVIIVTYFSLLTLYFHNEFNRIEIEIQNFQDSKTEIKKSISSSQSQLYEHEEKNEFAKERAEILYQKIISYFNEEHPFKDPDFSITLLAKKLDTNTTYIYKTLAIFTNKSFRDLVNEYRVNHILNAIEKNEHKVFTIEHIYLEAGFLQQSTFNRVFKKITGLTPSQYIESKTAL
ncbi:helix-turn-helix domain-containing protein [Flavobacterium qiangtangense]|uniref:Helix-turn-helix domain-containing protein n=1 Tax=Flavobacterium qiangtangense TaxID=1442595 RepID=A0ABW1PRD6_9FLAO